MCRHEAALIRLRSCTALRPTLWLNCSACLQEVRSMLKARKLGVHTPGAPPLLHAMDAMLHHALCTAPAT